MDADAHLALANVTMKLGILNRELRRSNGIDDPTTCTPKLRLTWRTLVFCYLFLLLMIRVVPLTREVALCDLRVWDHEPRIRVTSLDSRCQAVIPFASANSGLPVSGLNKKESLIQIIFHSSLIDACFL